jgi:hypothetical protein
MAAGALAGAEEGRPPAGHLQLLGRRGCVDPIRAVRAIDSDNCRRLPSAGPGRFREHPARPAKEPHQSLIMQIVSISPCRPVGKTYCRALRQPGRISAGVFGRPPLFQRSRATACNRQRPKRRQHLSEARTVAASRGGSPGNPGGSRASVQVLRKSQRRGGSVRSGFSATEPSCACCLYYNITDRC